MAKEAEKRTVAIARFYGWYSHKYGDVRKCIHCQGLLPKTENAPDYAIAPIFTWVEAKNSGSTERWNWEEIGPEGARKNQRAWLIKNGGWLLIELSNKDARGANGRMAYLVPFKKWLSEVEPILLKLEMKSIRLDTKGNRPGADSLLKTWELEWTPTVGWTIPPGHIWWTALISRAESLLREALAYDAAKQNNPE